MGTATAAESQSSVSADPSSGESTEYVPATKDHPAQNVPKPVMPDAIKYQTAEGAKEFVKYWDESLNYLLDTGDPSYLKAITMVDSDLMDQVITDYSDAYKNGNWSVGVRMNTSVPDQNIIIGSDGETSIFVRQKRSAGNFSGPSANQTPIPEQNFNGQPIEMVANFDGGIWKFSNLQKIEGVDYGKE